jgi:uncharacterized protein YndB with AHSA1/START domain
MQFDTDKQNRKIFVKREFKAPISRVWRAWTDSTILDQWWAPKPWKAKTKEMNFTVGGHWLYAMQGPEGEEHWSRADYKAIEQQQSFTCADAFCDSNGKPIETMATSKWNVHFAPEGDSTLVDIEISFDRLEDMEMLIKMGFQGGFTMGMGNLDELLAKQEVSA